MLIFTRWTCHITHEEPKMCEIFLYVDVSISHVYIFTVKKKIRKTLPECLHLTFTQEFRENYIHLYVTRSLVIHSIHSHLDNIKKI